MPSKEYMRAWREAHPGKMQEYDRKWRMANPESAKESDRRKQRKYFETHPEYRAKAVARTKRWAVKNPERWQANMLAISQRRRARINNVKIGPIDYHKILVDSGGQCGICKEPIGPGPIEFDHIIPIAKGGSHTQDNIQLSHPSCNRRKSAKIV